MADARHRVVIVGGGFAGLLAARSLRKAPVDVTLVDRRNYHLFQPLLYQVATGGLSPGDIAAPLRAVLRKQENTRVVLAEVTGFEPGRRRVALADGFVEYDTLVVAAGAVNHYFGNDHWAKSAPGLKSIEEATEIRHRILLAFERAEWEPDPEKRKAWLRFVVVGAGPTGVELAGTIAEISRDTLRGDFRTIRPEESQILLVEGSQRVLPPFAPILSEKAERQLLRLGVRARTGVRVVSIDAHGVELESSLGREHIASRTVLWAAGVRASPLGEALAQATGAQTDRGGRVVVNPDLSLPDHPEILVIGDLAHFEQDGKPLPGVAPVAMQQGRHAGRVIRSRLEGTPAPGFRYFDKGNLATIGRAAAVADFGFVRFSGFFAWILWLFVHLLYIVGFQNRVLVAIQWGFQYFTYNRGARLITGDIGAAEGARAENETAARTAPPR